MEALADDVLERARGAGPGTVDGNNWVKDQVKQFRREAFRETAKDMDTDPFPFPDVEQVLATINLDRASQRLPRGASVARGGLYVSWALVNLAAILGLVASSWIRDVTPIHKRGPRTVTRSRT